MLIKHAKRIKARGESMGWTKGHIQVIAIAVLFVGALVFFRSSEGVQRFLGIETTGETAEISTPTEDALLVRQWTEGLLNNINNQKQAGKKSDNGAVLGNSSEAVSNNGEEFLPRGPMKTD